MNLKPLFIAAGIAWGIVLGIATVMAVVAMAAGFAWLFLFGDNPWPDWAETAILIVGGAAGLAVFITCIMLGWSAGRRFDDTMSDTRRRIRATGWAASGVLALAMTVTAIWHESARVDQRREATVTHLGSYELLLTETHRISKIEIDWPGGGNDGHAILKVEGMRDGPYRLSWRVRDQLHKEPVLKGVRPTDLTAGDGHIEILIPAQDLAAGYRGLLAHDNANVLVDEPFVFEARLVPVLTDTERAAIPQNERHNLGLGQSGLIGEASGNFSVRFFLFNGAPSWQAR